MKAEYRGPSIALEAPKPERPRGNNPTSLYGLILPKVRTRYVICNTKVHTSVTH
jgi:hypothetical protein